MVNELIRDSTGRLVVNPDYHPQYKGYNEITSPTPYNTQRALDLAKLRELTMTPGFEERRIGLAEKSLETTQAQNAAEQKHWADLLGLDQNKLKETAREHDSALSELTDYHKGVLKNQLAGDFMAHVASLYTGDPSKVKQATGALTPILDKLGLHEITAGLQLANEAQNKTVADTTLQQINLGRTKGIDITPLVENLKTTNPDAYGLIKDKIPTTSITPTKSKTNFAQLLAKVVKYGTGPGLLFGAGQAASGLDLTGVRNQLSKSFLDFHNALMQRE